MENYYDILVIGGGASGFFTAINAAKELPNKKVAILERTKEGLNKVRISGGGRCNVTHGEFLPKPLSENYPRGEKELLGPFHKFMTGDVFAWFEERGVPLHIEEDGRAFPTTNSSETIIDCFLQEADRYGVTCFYRTNVTRIEKENKLWKVFTSNEVFYATNLVMATGSSPKVWRMLSRMGYDIVDPVPSLFTFHCEDPRIADLQGVSAETSVQVLDASGKSVLNSDGPLLVTHWGMSGPAILKLSAWGARELHALDYKFSLKINWIPTHNEDSALRELQQLQKEEPRKKCENTPSFNLPRRLWQRLVQISGIDEVRWADVSKVQMQALIKELSEGIYAIDGKSTFKEEFVTAGGVALKQIDFNNFTSKRQENLYFVGEVIDIDAITGGFNFQHAWTGGFLVAQDLIKKYAE